MCVGRKQACIYAKTNGETKINKQWQIFNEKYLRVNKSESIAWLFKTLWEYLRDFS